MFSGRTMSQKWGRVKIDLWNRPHTFGTITFVCALKIFRTYLWAQTQKVRAIWEKTYLRHILTILRLRSKDRSPAHERHFPLKACYLLIAWEEKIKSRRLPKSKWRFAMKKDWFWTFKMPVWNKYQFMRAKRIQIEYTKWSYLEYFITVLIEVL